jgi:EAL domain-containing protein (putative c-di-GMP-specific phosphodiesterase class I)
MPERAESSAAKLRFLGLAFAGADLVFEVDRQGRISFALGAIAQLCGCDHAAVIGMNWSDLVEPEDSEMLAMLLDAVKPGERQGPLAVALRRRPTDRLRRQAGLSVFRLPQREGSLSCALTLGGLQRLDGLERDASGLLSPASFEQVAVRLVEQAQRGGLPVRLDLVELDGLSETVAAMDGPEGERTRRQVAATLRARSFGGVGAAEVAADRFAMVSDGAASATAVLSERIGAITSDKVRCRTAGLPLTAGATAQTLRAMRYALDRYIEEGAEAAATGFQATVQRTVQDAARFRAVLDGADFQIVYQPVVALADGAIHHFEALARFEVDASPADTIRLAEELGLIAEFDMAVLNHVAGVLRASEPRVRIAVNVSADTLLRPAFLEGVVQATSGDGTLPARLLVEITETQKIADLPQAGQVIAALRAEGHVVCIDDFGVGAASLDYLRRLEVDIVKLDGSFVQGLDASSRDRILLRHVISLCRDLNVRTIAEMVETEAVSELLRELGADFAQGWRYGRPQAAPTLPPPPAPPAPRLRRKGLTEQWG